MVDYGQDKKYQVHIERVDYYPEIAGVKITNFPVVFVMSVVPLWFNQMFLAVAVLIGLVCFFYVAGRREDEGRPIFLNASIIRLLSFVPKPAKQFLTPSLASIKAHEKTFRR